MEVVGAVVSCSAVEEKSMTPLVDDSTTPVGKRSVVDTSPIMSVEEISLVDRRSVDKKGSVEGMMPSVVVEGKRSVTDKSMLVPENKSEVDSTPSLDVVGTRSGIDKSGEEVGKDRSVADKSVSRADEVSVGKMSPMVVSLDKRSVPGRSLDKRSVVLISRSVVLGMAALEVRLLTSEVKLSTISVTKSLSSSSGVPVDSARAESRSSLTEETISPMVVVAVDKMSDAELIRPRSGVVVAVRMSEIDERVSLADERMSSTVVVSGAVKLVSSVELIELRTASSEVERSPDVEASKSTLVLDGSATSEEVKFSRVSDTSGVVAVKLASVSEREFSTALTVADALAMISEVMDSMVLTISEIDAGSVGVLAVKLAKTSERELSIDSTTSVALDD
jgi:hypothetical protein